MDWENFHKARTVYSDLEAWESSVSGATLTHSDAIGRVKLKKLEARAR